MSAAQEQVARTFDLAYRNAGGKGNAREHLKTGRRPFPDTRPRITEAGGLTYRRLHPDEGSGDIDISENHLGRTMPDGTRRLPISDLRLTAIAAASLARAERRREAISAMSDEIDPLWSLTAHPLLAAAIRLYNIDLETARLGDGERQKVDDGALADAIMGYDYDQAKGNMKVVAGHLWAASLEETRTGISISQARGRMLARITIMDMTFPDTVAAAMKGRPLSDVLDHPLVDFVPDLKVHRLIGQTQTPPDGSLMGNFKAKMTRRPRTVIEVVARSVPIAAAPDGVDTTWRRLPALHYGDIE